MTRTLGSARLLALLSATVILAAACSLQVGEPRAAVDSSPDPSVNEPVNPEPASQTKTPGPDSEQPESTPSDSERSDTERSDSGPSESGLTETTPEFCEAGRTAFESFLVLELVPIGAGRSALEPTIVQLLVDINLALEVAPNEQLAAGPQFAFLSMNNIRNTAIELDFDDSALLAAGENELSEDFETFQAIMDALQQYLEGPCGFDLTNNRVNAEARAQTLLDQAQPAGSVEAAGTAGAERPVETENAAGSAAASVHVVQGDWGDVQVTVPTGWTMEESWGDDQSRGLVVAPDLSAYDSSWDADGVAIAAVVVDGTAEIDLATLVAETAASSECSPAGSSSYADGLYTGEIHRFEACGGGSTEAVVIAALTDDRSLVVLLEMQMVDFDEAVLATIADSFRA